MRRGIGKKDTLKLIQKFRDVLPQAALRTSFIVGYPGETQEEFEELLEFIEQTRFEEWAYSHTARRKEPLQPDSPTMFPKKLKRKGQACSWRDKVKSVLKKPGTYRKNHAGAC